MNTASSVGNEPREEDEAAQAIGTKVGWQNQRRCVKVLLVQIHGPTESVSRSIRRRDLDGRIVFDDTISSVDSRRRWDFAARLVAGAHHRQVIVFTHDFHYLGIVQQKVEELGAPLTAQYIRRTGKGTSCFLPTIEFNSPAIG